MNRYEIRVACHLDKRRAHALGCQDFRLLPDGSSLLVFAPADQAALYGLLARLRDAGLELVGAERAVPSAGARGHSIAPPKEDFDVGDR